MVLQSLEGTLVTFQSPTPAKGASPEGVQQEDFMPNPAPSSGSPGCLNPFSSKPAIVIFISGTHHALRDSHKDLCSQQAAEPTKSPATSRNAPKVSPPPSLPPSLQQIQGHSLIPSRGSDRESVEINQEGTGAAGTACPELGLCSSLERQRCFLS